MNEMNEPDLRERLASMGQAPGPAASGPARRQPPKPALGAALLGGAAILAGLVYVWSQPEAAPDMDVRQAQEFQNEGEGFGALERPVRTEPVVVDVPSPPPAQENNELVEMIRNLQAQIDRMADAPETANPDPDQAEEPALESLRAELDDLRAEAERREAELRQTIEARDLQIAGLNADMDMMRLQSGQGFTPGETGQAFGMDPAQTEQARLQSSMIALGGSGDAGGAAAVAAGFGDGAAAQQAARLSQDAQFVRDAGRPVQVQRAEIIVNPSNTVTQGTMIQAVLDTAIDSTLEGPIRGLVTTDVVSYDGSRILIPRGSRLIGTYSSEVDIGSSRLLVAWERIIMPDNQSVQISAFGGDALGRSGTTGRVNSHFLRRFGAAALTSTISAIPSLVSRDSSDGAVTISTGGSNAASTGVANALSGATDAAVGRFLSISPTIAVPQGTRITVMVDRDLEIF
ncbi:TrbI/VirB10 family protein [Paracoccus aestuarii]|uniref:TrbI/VirB10 family protein n=1 Tax=Paracoccus aestuarii TaxID=453842 RepID=A0A418ZY88_9RHOB|nr:TrbI/VirB10 family protein [Paracoccus aestuarii]RJL05472.1 TrbI/VirB10 family protein [Paracoccus aestuarii]WCR01284.1 TrbI/VirB10 family protein [Paracoccus aestuarii]